MMRYARSLVILVGVVFLGLCLVGHSAGRVGPGPVRRIEKAEDPHEGSVIVVEAFMVEVRLSELYELGVPVISEGGKSVSAEHILKCLKDAETAAVTAGAKLAVAHTERAKTDMTARQGKYVGPAKEKRFEFQEVGTSLTVEAQILRGGRILVELDFEHSCLEENEPADDDGLWPASVRWNWSNSVSLEAAKPTLIGATQDQETATFLIITANIKK